MRQESEIFCRGVGTLGKGIIGGAVHTHSLIPSPKANAGNRQLELSSDRVRPNSTVQIPIQFFLLHYYPQRHQSILMQRFNHLGGSQIRNPRIFGASIACRSPSMSLVKASDASREER